MQFDEGNGSPMKTVLICGLLLTLGACNSTQQERWDMYRFDKHYRPYRVVVPIEVVNKNISPKSSVQHRTSLRYNTGRHSR